MMKFKFIIAGIKLLAFTALSAQQKPNVLFLLADDQRADALGCAGNTYIRTPNIDRLAGTGMRFTNAYIMGGYHGAISAPSRAMLLTGRNLFHVNDSLEGMTTMPQYFARLGYETFGTGKWHNGAKSFESSFQKGENVFIGGMYDHFGVPCQTLGSNGKLGEIVKKGYSTDIFAEAAIDFIESYAEGPKNKPFFCYVAFTAPHDPRSPREDYIGKYADESIPVPGNFKKFHPFAFDDMHIRDENLAPWPRTPEIIQTSLADYYAMISHLDERIGDIIKTLKEEGLFENTIIVYAADNGLAIGSHGLLGKQNLYEHSVKVPLIVSGPGIPKDKVSDTYIYLYDLFPTLADLCHLPKPTDIDGENFTSVIHGKSDNVRSSLFTAYRHTVRAVRTKEWKLIRYPERNYSQLFHLKNDPLEIHNLANDSVYSTKLGEMTELLQQLQTEVGDTVSFKAKTILPMNYDPTKFRQTPDTNQPKYILKKYFKNF